MLAMTVTLDIPADLQGTLLARAAMNGSNMEETIVILLRDNVIAHGSSQQPLMPPQRLSPGLYPDEAGPMTPPINLYYLRSAVP